MSACGELLVLGDYRFLHMAKVLVAFGFVMLAVQVGVLNCCCGEARDACVGF